MLRIVEGVPTRVPSIIPDDCEDEEAKLKELGFIRANRWATSGADDILEIYHSFVNKGHYYIALWMEDTRCEVFYAKSFLEFVEVMKFINPVLQGVYLDRIEEVLTQLRYYVDEAERKQHEPRIGRSFGT